MSSGNASPTGSSSGGSTSTGGSSGSGSSGGAGAPGVPCDVATMLSTNCNACHSDPPLTGALAGLVTYADLMAPSHEMPSENEAQLSLARMRNAASPMPPGGVASAADVATLQNWINAGYPMGSCQASSDAGAGSGETDSSAPSNTGSPPPNPPTGVFANAAAFQAGTGVSGHHNAGQNCMQSCHNHGFTFAGTVVDATGTGVAGAEVRLVDAKGQVISVYSASGGSQGNFYSKLAFTGPAQVGVRNATSSQNMLTALQTTAQAPASTGGACNACHCTGGACTIAAVHLP